MYVLMYTVEDTGVQKCFNVIISTCVYVNVGKKLILIYHLC